MLRELRIRNFAVVENVTVPFAPGLNVLTGETGAGKSILVDAILLVRGARAQTDVIRADAESATVEAVFAVPDGGVGRPRAPPRRRTRPRAARGPPALPGVGAGRRAAAPGRGGGAAHGTAPAPARRALRGRAGGGRHVAAGRRRLRGGPARARDTGPD